MKLYASKINIFTTKDDRQVCIIEGIRYKKENDSYKGEYKKVWLYDFSPTIITDVHYLPKIFNLKYDTELKCYKEVE